MTQSAVCVLVLDADEATRALYQRTLSRKWRIVACASEEEATSALNRTRVDALVVEPATLNDAEWSFLHRMRVRHPRGERLFPIIVCSTLDQRRQGVELGVSAYLIKPVSPQTLQNVLASLLETHTKEASHATKDASAHSSGELPGAAGKGIEGEARKSAKKTPEKTTEKQCT